MTRTRRILSIALRWAVGLGILAYLVVALEWGPVWHSIKGANLAWLGTGLAISFLVRVLHGYQLAVGVRHHGVSLSVWRAFTVSLIASFYSLFLPGQLTAGVVKWHRLSKESGRRAEIFATILFVRLVNSGIVLAFGAAALVADPSLATGKLPWIGLAIAVGIGVLLFLILARHGATPEHAAGGSQPSGFLRRGLAKLTNALRQYRSLSARQVFGIVAVPVVGQFLSAGVFLAAAHSLGLPVPPVSFVWLVSLVYFITMVPATVSGLGLREGALVFLLPHYGVDRSDALAFSLLLFSITLAIGLFGGLLEAWETLLNPRTTAQLPSRDERSRP